MRTRSVPLYCEQEFEADIDRLISWRGDAVRSRLLAAGINAFGKPVRSTPHFSALGEYDRPLEACRNSAYVRYYNALAAAGHKRDNDSEAIASGLDRLRQFREFFHYVANGGEFEPIRVVARSDGRFRIADGQHRAAIALKLGCRTIPAKMVKVDGRFKSLLSMLYKDWPHHRRALYQPVEHPAFKDWKIIRGGERWQRLKNAIDWKNKSVLEIGSHTGYFARNLSRHGSRVVGVDTNARRIKIARRLSVLFGTRCQFFHKDFRDVLRKKQFDVVLFLSVMHWILRNEGLLGVARCLSSISHTAPMMLFEMAGEHEPKMREAEWNHGLRLNRETIPQLVLQHSAYTRWRLLGSDDRQRDLFMFWRD